MEDAPLLKQTLRATAWMLLPTTLFLGLITAAALAMAPASRPANAEEPSVNVVGDGHGGAASPAAEHDKPPRGTRASVKVAPPKI